MVESRKGLSRGGKGTYLDKEIIKSQAFRSLSQAGMLWLLDFRLKLRIKKQNKYGDVKSIINNGEIVFTYKEGEELGFSKRRFMKGLDDCIERGFVSIANTGAGLNRTVTLYASSEMWKKFGTPEFKISPRKRSSSRSPNAGFKKGHPYYPPRRK